MLHRRLILSLCLLLSLRAAHAQDLVVYDNALENGWVDYSWASVSFTATSPVHGSSGDSIAVTADAYQALYLSHAAFDSTDYSALNFWINGGAVGGQPLILQATLNGKAQTVVHLTAPTANTWTKVTVNLSDLGVANNATFNGFWIQSQSGSTLPTFYVDDVTLTANPPPATVQLTVDAASIVRTVDPRIFGLNTAVWDAQLGTTATRTILTGLKIGALRCPGGSSSDDYDWQVNREVTNNTFTWTSGFPMAAAHAAALGAQLYTTINYGSGTPEQAAAWVAYANGDPANTATLGTDSKGRDWKTVGYWAAIRAASPIATDDGYNFLRIAHPAGFGFKYWEIGNECYGGWEHDEHGSTFSGVPHDPYTYAQAFAVYRQKMLAVDPTVHLGAVVTNDQDSYGVGTHAVANPRDGTTHTGWTAVLLANLASQGTLPAFLVYHDYPQNPGAENDATLLSVGATLAKNDAAALRGLLNDYVGNPAAANIELALTELNSVSSQPGKQGVSLVDGLFLADTMGALAATEFNACTWWDLRNGSETDGNMSSALYGWRQFGDYGVVAPGDRPDTPLNTPYPSYYTAKLLTQWAAGGDRIVTTTSNYTHLTVYGALRANGGLSLLIVNKHPTVACNAQVALSGFTPASSTATTYQYGPTNDTNNVDLTTATLNGVGANFAATFPAYSMTVVNLVGPPGSFAAWENLHFTSTELNDPTISGDTADPDHDGVPNILEYALGMDPRVAARSGLPSQSLTTISGATYPTLTYTKVKAETDLTYTVEVSGDLNTWHSGSGYTVDVGTVDNGATQQVTTRDVTALTAGVRRYMRLRVSR